MLWSWKRTGITVVPTSRSRWMTSVRSAAMRAASKSGRRVSFMPATSSATSGRCATAAGTCSVSTHRIRAPVNDGFR